ncbi:MAG TPA: PH domain-containing protein [Candidatus Saccharimonadales bacterium]|nr:PH domain-containing protein [Candidatus Saccharimonadales bacterium]
MVDPKSVEAQLKRIKFSSSAWGRAEVRELPNILSPDEKIYECVNGMYDGGFALLVSTDMRVLLVDKKPLNYLTVEDMRFDMINELDYSHRLFGAMITISAGNKTLHFRSYNQQRLRKLISHVQDRMSEIKKEQNDHQEDQKKHLMQINQQLQAYLLAQHQQLMQMQRGDNKEVSDTTKQSIKPSPELSDYLFAQSLMREFSSLAQDTRSSEPEPTKQQTVHDDAPAAVTSEEEAHEAPATEDLYAEGYKEIFGKQKTAQVSVPDSSLTNYAQQVTGFTAKNLEVNPLRIAYAKLPMALRNRKFGRPSFHAHSQARTTTSARNQSAVQA